ncbi:Adenine nucleotide alpha hydrolases-like superfamily protein [Heracleum sosnowskyi]|uniref:Adenine nucleotide alpha hydrolases-like superfamily protein n=1 Tax=Heracleum sosnowskyi TaxID=360622 RepID=A0AAD8IRL9_9APIA|nr:Adenine nucleotide alpha hydrolases-like superfamily protein [Heracleum sosnowskyi]
MESKTVVEPMELPPELQKPLVPVPETEQKKKLKVLVAIDDSELSFYALQWALDNLFKNLGNDQSSMDMNQQDSGTLTVAHVMSPFHHYAFPAAEPGVYAANTVVESARKGQSKLAAGILDRAVKLCKEKNVKAESLLLEGDPKDMICQIVQEIHVDLLVLGSRGLGMIKRAFMGSVSDYCVHHAKCPVLIVRPPKESTHHQKSGE